MQLSLAWLREVLPDLPATEKLENLLASLGFPLEGLSATPALDPGIVCAKVLVAELLPGSALRRLTLDDGQGTVSVLSGAPNAAAGNCVALARPGSFLTGILAPVSERRIQGEISYGMACSAKELGIGEDGSGLLVFPGETEPGRPLAELWPADQHLDIEVTPNRGDVLSVRGLARELAAALGVSLAWPEPATVAPSPGNLRAELGPGCDAFAALQLTVRPGPSPAWLQRRLAGSRIRSLGCLVDVSNYVMLELGQPTAFYDRRDLASPSLAVRPAYPGEVFFGLGGVRCELGEEDLVIRSDDLTVGLAGILGGERGQIRPDSSEILVEAAHFDPVRLRRSGKRLGLRTEALYRFERGVDPQLPEEATCRIAELLRQVAGGRLLASTYRAGLNPQPTVTLSGEQVERLLGYAVPLPRMEALLTSLGCLVSQEGAALAVTPPSWRGDLQLPEDLTEEIARLDGYDKIPYRLPTITPAGDNLETGGEDRQRQRLRRALIGAGAQELVHYSFTNAAEISATRSPQAALLLENPLSSERTALYPGLLRTLRSPEYQAGGLVFEIGHVFPEGGECERVGVAMRGPLISAGWQPGFGEGPLAFKAVLEKVAWNWGADLEVLPPEGDPPAHLHPRVCGRLRWNGQVAGWMGLLHPAVQEACASGPLAVAELAWPLASKERTFQEPSRHPAALRDLAVLTPRSVSFWELRSLLASSSELLESAEAFDLYEGSAIPAGMRSTAVRLRYRGTKTLSEEEIEAAFAAAIAAVRRAGWEIRDRPS